MKFIFWIAAAAVWLLGTAATADMPAPDSSAYTNLDYQFSVKLPKGFLACVGEITNSGVVILLDNSKRCDGNYFTSPGIFINAHYSAAGIADPPWGLAKVECRWDGARNIIWLHGQKMSGREAAGCRRSFASGHIEVSYIVLRKTSQDPLQWIEISADLITTPARYTADMPVFRRVLPDIWVHADGPFG